MTQYEARYFVSRNEFSACLGRQGDTTEYTKEQILTNKAKPLIEKLTNEINKFLSFNPHMKPEDHSKVYVFYELDVDGYVNINFWISPQPPSVSLVYDGKKKMTNPQSVIEAHTWELSLGAPFANYKEHADKYINAFLEKERSFPDNSFPTLHMFQEDIYFPPYLYGHFRKRVNLKPYYLEALSKCPNNCYPVEIGYLARGWFVWVKKEAWNRGKITLSDVLFYE